MSFPTVVGRAVEGTPYREAQSCLGTAFANSTYKFFLSGTSTPANVYQNGTLTTAFPTPGVVTSDNFSRFPAIYLDPSVIYKVQFFDKTSALRWTVDPYTSQLATVGTSSLSAFGFQIALTGEVIIDAPNTGGTGVSLTLNSGALGTAALSITGTAAGNSALIVNNSATTGIRTATFTATNKPGTATSSPAGWLPITCDGVQYYTPIWHGNPFTPYVPGSPAPQGQSINASSVTFGGNGVTTATGGTAIPSNWIIPPAAGIGAGYFINITKTGGLSGLNFNIAATATVAPSGAGYVGGSLTSPWTGSTGSFYSITLSTGQVLSGVTLTNGLAAFTTPSTTILFAPSTALLIAVQGGWINISSSGLTISDNAQAAVAGTYQISPSVTGSPALANGTITIANNNGVQSSTFNVATPIFFSISGGTVFGPGFANSGPSWFTPTTAGAGLFYYIKITQTGGTPGYSFSAATGAFTALNNLTVGISGPGSGNPFSVTGTYIIASDSGGVNQLGAGSITLTGTSVQSPSWSGTTPLKINGNGSATLNGVATSDWYTPNVANVGSGYWINVSRSGGTVGVNFTTAQGSWANITNSGLTIDLTGSGTASVFGSWAISNSPTGSPILGSGGLTLNR